MKSIMRNLAFVAVAVMYIVSTMGYGVHRCTADGTASVILLFGETPCEYVHSHMNECCGNHGCSQECDAARHSSDCCSTNVYVLTEDQNIGQDNISVSLDFQIINAASVCIRHQLAFSAVLLGEPEYNLKIFPFSKQMQASLCTFRS